MSKGTPGGAGYRPSPLQQVGAIKARGLDGDEQLAWSWDGVGPFFHDQGPCLDHNGAHGRSVCGTGPNRRGRRETDSGKLCGQGRPAPKAPGGMGVSITLVPVSSACTTMPPPMYMTTW